MDFVFCWCLIEQLNKLKVDDLKAFLASKGVVSAGRKVKTDLIAMVEDFLSAA